MTDGGAPHNEPYSLLTVIAASPFPLQHRVQRRLRFLRQMVGLLVRWILARYHVGTEAMHRVADQRGRVGIAAHKFGRWAEGQVQDVVEDEHLAIALRSSSDADSWSWHFRRDHGGDFPRNAFEINAGHASAIKCYGIAHELL